MPPADSALTWRYDLRSGDHLIYREDLSPGDRRARGVRARLRPRQAVRLSLRERRTLRMGVARAGAQRERRAGARRRAAQPGTRRQHCDLARYHRAVSPRTSASGFTRGSWDAPATRRPTSSPLAATRGSRGPRGARCGARSSGMRSSCRRCRPNPCALAIAGSPPTPSLSTCTSSAPTRCRRTLLPRRRLRERRRAHPAPDRRLERGSPRALVLPRLADRAARRARGDISGRELLQGSRNGPAGPSATRARGADGRVAAKRRAQTGRARGGRDRRQRAVPAVLASPGIDSISPGPTPPPLACCSRNVSRGRGTTADG